MASSILCSAGVRIVGQPEIDKETGKLLESCVSEKARIHELIGNWMTVRPSVAQNGDKIAPTAVLGL